ncbi:MAG: hypothetical protein NVSMB1_00250 [Polyangiales bacterium]
MKLCTQSRVVAVAVVNCLLGAPLASPAAAPQGNVEAEARRTEARSHYERGLKLFDDADYEGARVEFERAYELSPTFRVLYNTGLCYRQLNNYVAALKALERYLKEGGAEIPADRRVEVEKVIADLRPVIAKVTVRVNVRGAEISVDDVVVGTSPLSEPVLVNPGRRKVSATLKTYIPQIKSITIAGSDSQEVILELSQAGTTYVVAPTTNWAPIVGFGVTGALAVGAGIFGVLTVKEANTQNDLVGKFGSSRSDLDDSHKKMRTYATVADVLAVSAIVTGGVSLFLTLNKGKKTEQPSATSVSLGFGPGSVRVVGAF